MRRAVFALVLANCYRPPQPACGFLCGPEGACPGGYTCNAADGFCHRDGTDVTCSLNTPVDAFDFFPRIATVMPEDMATEVAPDVIVSVKFTEQVMGVSETSFMLLPRDGFDPVAAVVTYDAATRTASLDPDALLDPSSFYVAVLGTEIVDLGGKPLVGPTTWSFKTMADLTPPMMTATVPADGATDVPIDIVLVADFTERVAIPNGAFQLASPTEQVPGTIGFVSVTAQSFTPLGQLLPNTVYTATLTSDIEDLYDNPLANAPVTWTFTTGADTEPPTVQMRVPDVDEPDVPLAAVVHVGFSEPVIGVSATSVTLEHAGGAVAASVTQPSPQVARLVPDQPLAPSTTFAVTLAPAITDPSGNPLSRAPVRWSFTTAAR